MNDFNNANNANENRERSIPITSRVDLKSLATCINYYDKQGVTITTKSSLIANIVEDFASLLVANSITPAIISDSAARAIIEKFDPELLRDKTRRRLLGKVTKEDILKNTAKKSKIEEKLRKQMGEDIPQEEIDNALEHLLDVGYDPDDEDGEDEDGDRENGEDEYEHE